MIRKNQQKNISDIFSNGIDFTKVAPEISEEEDESSADENVKIENPL